MMRSPTRLFAAVLMTTFACASASAALQATLPEGSGGRSWEMIAIDFPPTSGDIDVGVQDARGGPEFIRTVPGNVGRAWLPLPVVAPSTIPGTSRGAWPVVITLRSSHRIIEQSSVALPLGTGRSEANARRLASTAPVPAFDGVCVIVPGQEVLTGPTLLFAGCDWVYLSPDLQTRITRERALALLSVGTRLAAPVDPSSSPPGSAGGGPLSQILWERITLPGGTMMWLTTANPVPHPAVVEPDLAHMAAGFQHQDLPGAILSATLIAGPLALLLLTLQWGLFHRRRTVLLGSALSVAALAAGVILYLHAHALSQARVAQWRQAATSPESPAAALLLEEHLGCATAWFNTPLNISASPGCTIFPVAPTAAQYWSLDTVQWRFAGTPQLGGSLPARGILWYENRSTDILNSLPPYPRTADERARLWQSLHLVPTDAWWLIGGYVKPADAPEKPGVLFPAWAADQPWIISGNPDFASHGIPWYDMRVEPDHRYLLWRRNGIMNVLDFGLSADASAQTRLAP